MHCGGTLLLGLRNDETFVIERFLDAMMVGGQAARAVDGSDRCGGMDGLLVLIYFRVPEWWMCIRHPRTKVVAVAATTTATHRWTGGTRGQQVGLVWGNGRHEIVLVFFMGPKWWRCVCCPHTEVIAFDTATAATHRWQAVRAVEGPDQCGGMDGIGSSLSFSGAGVGARETRGVLRGVSDWALHVRMMTKGCRPAGAHNASATCG
jgi:hypothetical protein